VERGERVGSDTGVVAGGALPSELIGSLPRPATAVELAQFIALRAAACVGADYSNLALLDDSGTSLRLFHGPFLNPLIADRYTDVSVDDPYPIAAAARSGDVILLDNLDAYREHFPEILADTIAAGVQATASLPLHREDGSLLGAIGFAWVDPPGFTSILTQALRSVADLCTEIIVQAEHFDVEHQFLADLHRQLLYDVPQHSGLATAARYLPAGRTSSIGGDWYEGLILDENRVAFVVGDVTGHGMAAAADMALVRGMVTALLYSGLAVEDVFFHVSGVLRQRHGLLLATAAVVVVDVASNSLTFATAGHPPPLMLTDGQVQALDSANAPMLGVAATRRVAATAPFPPGSQLVLYTDGLVERRDRPYFIGVELAAQHLATLPDRLSPDELIDSLLETLIGPAVAQDDIAMLVIERLT
jgi:hypothetical protein